MIKHIPNTITSLNLLSGILGVIFTLNGRPDTAFLLMIAAAVFDFCDGLAARALGAYSEIGKELDSLADMVSFGVLPSLMLFVSMPVDGYAKYCPLILAVFSALRLAKFNLDERQHDSFIGLATPAAAMICGSLSYYFMQEPYAFLTTLSRTSWFLPAVAVVLSMLLLSEIPMFSMKFGKGKKADTLTTIKRIAFLTVTVIIVVVVLVSGINWSMIIFSGFIVYILMNLIFNAFNKK